MCVCTFIEEEALHLTLCNIVFQPQSSPQGRVLEVQSQKQSITASGRLGLLNGFTAWWAPGYIFCV